MGDLSHNPQKALGFLQRLRSVFTMFPQVWQFGQFRGSGVRGHFGGVCRTACCFSLIQGLSNAYHLGPYQALIKPFATQPPPQIPGQITLGPPRLSMHTRKFSFRSENDHPCLSGLSMLIQSPPQTPLGPHDHVSPSLRDRTGIPSGWWWWWWWLLLYLRQTNITTENHHC